MPFCFSSSQTRLFCTLPLEKRGGELGEHGEEPGGGNREGTEETLPSLHWWMPAKRLRLLLLAFLLLLPLPLRTGLRGGIALQRVLGPPYLSREPSASVDRGNQKLFSCFPCWQQRQLFFFSLDSPRLLSFGHPEQRTVTSPSGPIHRLPPPPLLERTLTGRLCARF